MKTKLLKTTFVLLLIAILCIPLTGCGSNSSVVGTWDFEAVGATLGYNAKTFTLYDDGKCVGSPITCPGGTEAVSYALESDGTLIFYDQWNGQKVVPRTEDKELAMEESEYYYISGDTMVIYTCTYKRR